MFLPLRRELLVLNCGLVLGFVMTSQWLPETEMKKDVFEMLWIGFVFWYITDYISASPSIDASDAIDCLHSTGYVCFEQYDSSATTQFTIDADSKAN